MQATNCLEYRLTSGFTSASKTFLQADLDGKLIGNLIVLKGLLAEANGGAETRLKHTAWTAEEAGFCTRLQAPVITLCVENRLHGRGVLRGVAFRPSERRVPLVSCLDKVCIHRNEGH